MRAPLSPLLLAAGWLSAAWLAGAGCASAPEEEQPAASTERPCVNDASDPLHMASSRPDEGRDWQVEAIMSQQPADPRLAQINRQMYLSLHALDVVLRKQQRIAECENPELSEPTLEAEAGGGAGGDGAGAEAGGGDAGAGASGSAAAGGAPAGGSGGALNVGPAVTAAAAHSAPVRTSSLSATGGGGNGATAQKGLAGSDNDIVLRRLRKAARAGDGSDLARQIVEGIRGLSAGNDDAVMARSVQRGGGAARDLSLCSPNSRLDGREVC